MEKIKQVKIKRFTGGTNPFEKLGPKNSGRFFKNIDIFKDPSYATLSKAATKVSGATVTDLVYWAVDGSPYDTNRYFLSEGGKFYRETSGDVWSSLRTVSGCSGEGLTIFDDYAYYALDTELGRYGRLSGTPAFDDALTSWWDANIDDLQTTGGGTGSTDYVPPTTIAETATARQTFTAEHDPLKEITIDVDVAGSGNWTITVHDEENNTIGSKTLANASISAADITFTFATALRLVIGNSYHFHVTSTVADGGVDTNVNSDLEGAEYVIEYGVLISAEFHPMVVVEDKLIIGNDSYLAVFDQATYEPNKILLERGFKVRTITKIDEYIVIGCYKGESVQEAEGGRLFYWDTISVSWNYFTDTTSVGAPNVLGNIENELYGIYGNKGTLYKGDKPFVELIHKIFDTGGKRINVFPGAMSAINAVTLLGLAGDTDSGAETDAFEHGIWAYGTAHESIPKSYVLLHAMSTGTTQGANVRISFVQVFGDDIYFGWRDGSSYGVDKISPDALASTEGVFASLVFDNGDTQKEFLAVQVISQCDQLGSGETLISKYKLDKTGTFTAGDTATNGDKTATVPIYKRAREAEILFVLGSTGGTYPKVTEICLYYNPLNQERRL